MADFYTFEQSQQKKTRKSNEKLNLVIGVLLLLISIGISIASSVISLGGIYRLNDDSVKSSVFILAPVVIMLVFSSLVLISGRKKRGRNFLIFSIMALLLNLYNLSTSLNMVQTERIKEEVAVEKARVLIRNFLAEKVIIREEATEEKYGRSAQLIDAIQSSYLEFDKIREEIHSVEGRIKENTEFSVETLSSLKEKIEALEQTSSDISKINNEIEKFTDKFKERISNVYVSGVVRDKIMSDLEYSIYTYTDILKINLKYMNEAAKNSRNFYAFIDEKQGAYKVANYKIVFYEEKDGKEYDELNKLFDKAVAENTWNYMHFTEVMEEKIRELEKVTE